MPGETAYLNIRVTPKAGRSRVTAFRDGAFRVSVSAPAHEGMANRELISFLSICLDVSKGSILIKRGEASRVKRVAVLGLSLEEAAAKLLKHIS